MTDMQIRCFLALAEYLNYTKAARILGISQSTLSTHIIALEKSIKLRLFIRNRRSVTLSPEGEIMLKALKETDSILKKALKEARSLENENSLNIGIMEGLNTQLLKGNFWENFQKAHPEIIIQFSSYRSSVLMECCDRGEVDAVLAYDLFWKSRKDMRGIPVFVSRVYLAKSLDRADEQLLQTPEKLSGEQFILQIKEENPFFDRYFDAFCRKYGIVPDKVLRVSTAASVMMNVEIGMGIGLVDDFSIIFQTPFYSFEEIEDARIEYDLIYKSSRIKNGLRTLIGELQEYGRQEIAE